MAVSLFQMGDFTLNSGNSSSWKIDCDALTETDWYTLAYLLKQKISGPFLKVLGIPRGGLPLEKHFIDSISLNSKKILIVDDVLTSGGSMEKTKRELSKVYNEHKIIGGVIFARGSSPKWVTPLFQM